MNLEILFGSWLRQQRRKMDLTQQKLADEVGCARITLRRIEAGELKPSSELAWLLLKRLGVPEAERGRWVRFARGEANMPISGQTEFSDRSQSNLPALLTSFIGRNQELAQVFKLLEKHRLVTLYGPGGVGKTRLSLEVGQRSLARFRDGIWLVELAPLNSPNLIPHTLAAIFGITPTTNTPITELVINFLRFKEALLIFDNCEHLLDGCAQLAGTLLKHCPSLKILTTSREALEIMGEALYQVPSLGLPGGENLLEKFREFESLFLFEQRAQLIEGDFSLTTENVASVAKICNHLNGIPLAIELAAVHVRLLSPAEIATQLEQCFDVLTGGNRAAMPRQQTIRASIDWSWNLLSDPERILLRRLSVFAGGWNLESAKPVCGDGILSSQQVATLLPQLVKKSLIGMNRESGGEIRYSFHEVLRQYAFEKLVEIEETAEIRSRHLKYFLQLSEQAEVALYGPDQAKWAAHLFAESDNIRTALEWAEKTDAVEAGLLISGRLMERFFSDFNMVEGARWVKIFLEKTTVYQFPQARAKGLLAYGYYAHRTQQRELMKKTAEESLAYCRKIGDQYGELDSLIMLARYYRPESQVQSTEYCQKALVLAETLEDKWRKAKVLERLGWCYYIPEGIPYLKEAVALFRGVGDLWLLLDSLGTLANFEITAGDLSSAQAHLDEAVQLKQTLGRKGGFEYMTFGLIEAVKGNFEASRAILEEGIAQAEQLGHRLNYLTGLGLLGHLFVLLESFDEAHKIFMKTSTELFKDGSQIGVCYSVEGLVGVFVAIDRYVIAARMIGWADSIRAVVKITRPNYIQENIEKSTAACINIIGETAFAAAYEEGQKMSLEEIMGLVT